MIFVLSETRIRPIPYEHVRLVLGRFLALGLEFQLAADILKTAVSPTFEDLGQLGAIAAIRTVLNYFLAQEIERAEEMEKEGMLMGPEDMPEPVGPQVARMSIAAAHLSAALTSAIATAIVAFAAIVIFAGSLSSLRAGRHAGRLLATYMGIGLEFFLAAGLIKLASADSFEMLGLIATIITLRRVIALGLGYAATRLGLDPESSES